jgi:hypothetical protein
VHWYSPIPTTHELVHTEITPLMVHSELKKIMKVLQKFLNVKYSNNVRILDILTDGYAQNIPRNKSDYDYRDKIFPQRFWNILRDKQYYLRREDYGRRSQEPYIAIMHITHTDSTLLSKLSTPRSFLHDGRKYNINKFNIIDTSRVFLLSDLLSILKGKRPYKIYAGTKNY